jgi:hypothetical protein
MQAPGSKMIVEATVMPHYRPHLKVDRYGYIAVTAKKNHLPQEKNRLTVAVDVDIAAVRADGENNGPSCKSATGDYWYV